MYDIESAGAGMTRRRSMVREREKNNYYRRRNIGGQITSSRM